MSRSQVNQGNTISTEALETTVACCTPALVAIRSSNAEVSACGCESAPPAAGEGACCGRQAAKFGIEVKAGGGCGCS